MRKFLIAAVMATSTMALAAPAAAQWQQAPYGAPYGNAYGYHNNYGQVRSLQVRINRLERQIARLDSRNILSDREAYRLRRDANQLERQLRAASYNGLNYRESQDLNYRLARLEQRLQIDARDGNRWGYSAYNNGWNNSGWDRDRDGLDDRYERDHGSDYDEDRDYD